MNVPKSGKLIQGVEAVATFLREIDRQMREERPELLSFMSIEFDEDGHPSILKATGTNIGAETPPLAELRQLAEARGIPWQDDYADRVIAWWASDERVDRHGDIVRQSWDFQNFDANPIILYGHDWDLPPIGNSLGERIVHRKDATEKAGKGTKDKPYEGPALQLLPLFATAEQWSWADTVFRLARAKFLRTGSVSFYPGTIIDVQDDDERSEIGLGRRGVIFEDNELLEFTIASVPANVGAHQILSSMRQRGLLQPQDIQPIRELVRRQIMRGAGDASEWRERDATMRGIWATIFPEVAVPEHCDLDVPLLMQELAEQSDRGSSFFGDPTHHFFAYKEAPGDELLAEGDLDAVTRPFPNEHACRVRQPGAFQDGSFRRQRTSSGGKRLDLILGRLKGKDTMTLQSFRYPKAAWTPAQAKSHCKSHDGAVFEPASSDDTSLSLEQVDERLTALADVVSEVRAIVEDIRSNQERVASGLPSVTPKETSVVSSALAECLGMTDRALAPSKV